MNESIASTCPARSTCKLHRIGCDVTCAGYSELTYQFRLSAIPKRYMTIGGQPASVETASTLLNSSGTSVALYRVASNRILDGDNVGLYLYSNMTGTGKSTSATALACDYIVRRVGQSLREGRAKSSAYVYYVNFPQFLEMVKRMFHDETDATIQEVRAIQERMTDAELVVWDDLGVTTASDSVQERVLSIIEARYDAPNIFTSNCSLNTLEDRLGARIVSRIHGMTTVIHVKGVDNRRERSE